MVQVGLELGFRVRRMVIELNGCERGEEQEQERKEKST